MSGVRTIRPIAELRTGAGRCALFFSPAISRYVLYDRPGAEPSYFTERARAFACFDMVASVQIARVGGGL